ncbi:MAG TPA: IclR family transcriptional regulator [Thiobacillaceae bacterium]|mgnify:CR=1 FL=1|nr:IclR family transcriptional regulator [Thiobacillaceae bacterium]
MKIETTSSIQVIDRLAALLDALASEGDGASLKILAAETGLHPSTAFRILGALAVHDFVARDEQGHYRLGPHLLRLAAKARVGLDVRAAARPEMEALRDQVGETVNLTVRQGDEVVYVERVTPNRMMRVEQVVGSRAPLHVTAVGKLMLGEAGAAAIRDYARRTKLTAYTPNTRADLQKLLEDVGASTARGYALDDEEAELGVGCIGALVRDATGNAVAGLSVSAPMERRRLEWVERVQEAARKISERLGYGQG